MPTSINPGLTLESGALDILFVGFSAFAIAILVAIAAGVIDSKNKRKPGAVPTAATVTIHTVGYAAMLAALVLVFVALFTSIGARDDYRDDVRSWLSSEYGIDVTQDEATLLVDRDEFGVELDGEIVAVQLSDGTGGTLQVREVDGHVIDPRPSKTSGK